MAAAVMARRLSSSLAASARSTPAGLPSAPTIRVTTRPFSTPRPHSSTNQPDPMKMREVAENLVSVLKETPSEATRSTAESLVNELKGFYPPSVESELTLKKMADRVSKIGKGQETRFTSGAGVEAWSKASRLADELGQLIEKRCPTKDELIKLSKDLSKALDTPLTEGLTIQELKLSMLQEELNKVKAGSDFQNNMACTMYGIFGCYVLGLSAAVFHARLQGENEEKKLSEKHSKLEKQLDGMELRLTKVEMKVELPSSREQVGETESEPAVKPQVGWLASLGNPFKSFQRRST